MKWQCPSSAASADKDIHDEMLVILELHARKEGLGFI